MPRRHVSATGRRLLSAEELDAWLRRWGLTVNEWGDYLERSVLLERGLGGDDPAAIGAEIAEAEFVDAVCSGFLEREALGFAADTALANLTPVETAGDRAVMIARTLEAAALARAATFSESSLEREIARRGLDWTRLELDVLEVPDKSAAREAALCIRHDGRSIADLAAECQGAVSRLSVYLDDLEPSLQPSLLAAQPGELVGPVEENDGFMLVAVSERKPASASDPELRRRAQTLLVDRLVRRSTEGRVEWHELGLAGPEVTERPEVVP